MSRVLLLFSALVAAAGLARSAEAAGAYCLLADDDNKTFYYTVIHLTDDDMAHPVKEQQSLSLRFINAVNGQHGTHFTDDQDACAVARTMSRAQDGLDEQMVPLQQQGYVGVLFGL